VSADKTATHPTPRDSSARPGACSVARATAPGRPNLRLLRQGEARVCALFGIRDLSLDAERERVERSRMLRVAWVDGLPDGDTEVTVATLAGRVEQVYLHIDLDALDPSIAPGIVDAPVPRGLSLGQLDEVLDAVTDRLALGGRRADGLPAAPRRGRHHARYSAARPRAHRRSLCYAAAPLRPTAAHRRSQPQEPVTARESRHNCPTRATQNRSAIPTSPPAERATTA
jgi:Arginase family